MKKMNLIVLAMIGLLLLAACTGGGETAVSPNNAEVSEVMAEDDKMADDEAMMDEESHDEMAEDAMMDDNKMAEDEAMMDEESHDEMSEDAMMDDDKMADDEAMMDDDNMADDDEMMSESMADLPAWQQIELTDARTGETFTLASFSGKTVFVEPMATWCTNCRRQLNNVREARAQLGDDVVFIGLSLETNLSAADLAQYQNDQGFDWTFAVMTPEMLQQLADTFGRSITSAPSTPHFIIRADGSYTELVTGIEPPDQIINQIQAAQS